MRRERKSAKEIVHDYAMELLNRTTDKDAPAKLAAIEVIALRMNWTTLYNQLRYRNNPSPAQQWWQK